MKRSSIQFKVLAILVVCLVLGVVCVIGLMHYFTVQNSQALAVDSITSSQKIFTILETREISKMTAVSDALIMNPEIRDALAAKDRTRLLSLTAPLYPQLKSEGITNWMFHTPEPDMTVFLRLHSPAKFGDHLNRYLDKEVAQAHTIVTGNELARAGFAERVLRPITDAQGKVIGYVEFGEELGQFIQTMKNQTGNEYELLLNKKFVDRKFWADSSANLKRRDDWDDNSNFVVAARTTSNDNILRFTGDLASVPDQGMVLEQFHDGDSIFVRGIFPIRDAAGNLAGAMFIVRDISGVYATMRRTQNILLVATVVSLSLGILFLLTLLNRVIFKRLQHIIKVATRVVGGDFESTIKVSSDDEVGKLEELFEQFRQIFVGILEQVAEVHELQEK
jgi:methyl-accepting chemotaxis protein